MSATALRTLTRAALRRWALWGMTGLLALAGGVAPAWAHKASGSYLTVNVPVAGAPGGTALSGRWDIALRDLDFALDLDRDGDGELTWAEVKARHGDMAAYAAQRLTLTADGQQCELSVGEQQLVQHTDGSYTVMPLSWSCDRPQGPLGVDYRLFAELDPQHRGLLQVRSGTQVSTAVLGGDEPSREFDLGSSAGQSGWDAFRDFTAQGVWHIWIGIDHVLFLLCLLLPSVLWWRYGQWRARDTAREAVVDVAQVVTAFTVAHSITLTLASLQWVVLPSRWVESVIAASVVLAALNNIWPVVKGHRWGLAFVFGLIHGFGFATVLSDLGLPAGALVLALLGFNVGVELGQLAIVALFIPLAWSLRRSWVYRQGVMSLGSGLIALLAGVWLVERAFEVKLLAWL